MLRRQAPRRTGTTARGEFASIGRGSISGSVRSRARRRNDRFGATPRASTISKASRPQHGTNASAAVDRARRTPLIVEHPKTNTSSNAPMSGHRSPEEVPPEEGSASDWPSLSRAASARRRRRDRRDCAQAVSVRVKPASRFFGLRLGLCGPYRNRRHIRLRSDRDDLVVSIAFAETLACRRIDRHFDRRIAIASRARSASNPRVGLRAD